MYFVDFLGKVLLPLFYCPIFFTLAYENFSKSNRDLTSESAQADKNEISYNKNKKNRYPLHGIKSVYYQNQTKDIPTKESRPRFSLLFKGTLCLAAGFGLAYMTYINLMWFVG
ncbi:MAG: hypothetical protein AAGF07_05265 [Patescibacteria group bacterium]